MGSLAIYTSQPTSARNASDMNLPIAALAELNDVDYLVEVLQPEDNVSEEEIAKGLATRAEALGIAIRPHTPLEHSNIGAGSDTTAASTHVRNTSAGSNETTDTALTTPSSPTTACPESLDQANLSTSPRARPRCLTFSQYDKYLAQVEPNLNQPRFIKQTIPMTDTTASIFSVSTRKSVVSIKNGIKAKVRWKKRASVSNAMMYVFLAYLILDSPSSS